MTINSPEVSVDVQRLVNIARPGGGLDVYLDDADTVIDYIRDPDGFAARYFGLTKVEYIEWIQLDGNALCAHRTKSGDLCRNLAGGSQLDAADWKAAHRKAACSRHRERATR